MADDLHARLLTDLQTLIAALALTGTPGVTGDVGASVYVEEQDANTQYPAVVLTARGQAESPNNALANTEEQGTDYPVALLLCDVPQVTLTEVGPTYLAWRHRIQQAVHEKNNTFVPPATRPPLLPHCPECAYTTARFLEALPEGPSQKLYGHENVVGGLVVECHCIEPR